MLNPPFHFKFSRSQRSPAVTKSGTIYYPIWLAYATGVLEKEGYSVKLYDAPAEGKTLEDVKNFVKKYKPDVIVCDTSTPSIYNDVKVASELKKETGALTILVGPHVSALPEETLKLSQDIDIICRKEYDYTLLDVVKTFENKGNLSKVKGITYRENGVIKSTEDRPFIENLDDLPFVSQVYSRHLNIRNYFYTNCQYPQVAIITGRGCPFGCPYCLYPNVMFGKRYRVRSVENVLDEFEWVEKNLPFVREIFIEDDTFTVNKERIFKFCEEKIRRKIKLPFTANARFDLDYETLKILKKAGCRLLCVGFETGDDEVMEIAKRGLKVSRAYKFMRDARKAGILIHGCFMIGFPGETKEKAKKTIEFAKILNPDTAQFFPIMVYPGTPMYEWVKEKGFLETEDFSQWITKDGLHNSVVSYPELSSKEQVALCDRARFEFYTRPKYLLYRLWRLFLHPVESQRILRSIPTFIKYLIRGTFENSSNNTRL